MAFELAAVAGAIGTFGAEIRGSRVRFFVDNASALALILKGSARRPDLNEIVATIWPRCADLNLEVEWQWVPSKSNIADGPSRQEFSQTEKLGAEQITMAWPELVQCQG